MEGNDKKINTTGKSNLKTLNKCPNFKHNITWSSFATANDHPEFFFLIKFYTKSLLIWHHVSQCLQ